MAKKNKNNHHLYQDKSSGVWYFQKRVPQREKPYKHSLNTKSVLEARNKRDEYLKELEQNGFIRTIDAIETAEKKASENIVFGEVAVKWADIKKTKIAETTFLNYRKVMNTHVLPAFGNYKIDASK
jgi:integrase